MGYRLSKIVTRKGDYGTTHLGDKKTLLKDHPRIEALGSLDELNSAIGLVIAYKPENSDITTTLLQIQQDLFDLGGELCPPYRIIIGKKQIERIEQKIQEWNATLPPLKEFILPGGNLKSATCHLARTICRRAERRLVTLNQDEKLNEEMLRYINRLSDLLFIIARILPQETSGEEVLWET